MNESIEPLLFFDRDIAEIAFNSDNPNFELQLVKLGISRSEAKAKTKLITLLKKKPTNFDREGCRRSVGISNYGVDELLYFHVCWGCISFVN